MNDNLTTPKMTYLKVWGGRSKYVMIWVSSKENLFLGVSDQVTLIYLSAQLQTLALRIMIFHMWQDL